MIYHLLTPSSLLRHYGEYGGTFEISGIVDELGAPGVYEVILFDRLTRRPIRRATSAADGFYVFDFLAYRDKGYTVIAYDRGDLPLNASIQDLVTPVPMGETAPAWDLPLLEGQAISGQAVGPGGAPAELVSIRDWESKRTLANIVPEADGTWSVTLPNGEYDITYFKDGCAPICHGPYLIDAG